jgi:hypothetical protein
LVSIGLRKRRRWRLFEIEMLGRIPGDGSGRVTEDSIMRSFMNYTADQVLLVSSNRVTCESYVARVGSVRSASDIMDGYVERKRPFGRPGVDKNVILIRVKKKCVGACGLHLSGSRQCPLSSELL